MSDILRMPGAWDSTWESTPVTTHQVPVPTPPSCSDTSQGTNTGPTSLPRQAPLPRFSTTLRPPSARQVSLETSFPRISVAPPPPLPWLPGPPPPPPSRTVPVPTPQLNSARTWKRDYNPFGFQRALTNEEPGKAPKVRVPPPPRYALFADTSDTGRNSDVIEESKIPIVVAVFGQTGTGKTSFIKAVTGTDLKVGHGLTSCTEVVLEVPCIIDNENVVLIDTPGFSDTNVSDTDILRRIADWMKDTYDEGFLLSGIIYLHRIIDTRMDGPSLKNLRMMKKLCGADSLQNVVLATTMWERVTEDEGLNREEELIQTFWKDMIDGGSTFTRIMTQSQDEARALVRSLLKNKPKPTRLQEELHRGKPLVQTEAGIEIMEEIAKLERKLKAEHEAEMMELRDAQRNHNQQLVRQVREDLAESRRRITRLELEKTLLENSKLRKLPKVERKGIFGWGSYPCQGCGNKTKEVGRWTCEKCGHEQRNKWW